MTPYQTPKGVFAWLMAHSHIRFLAIASLTILMMGCQLPGAQSVQNDSLSQAQYLPIEATMEVNGVEIGLEVARTRKQQALGLMYRTELGDNRGMLFPFQPPRQMGFWMKNTLIPLDIIYIKDKTVETIHANVPPCKTRQCPTYQSKGAIDQVIELPGGQADRLGLKEGDQITLTMLAK